MKTSPWLSLILLITFCSCKKQVSEDEQTCINITNAIITHNSPLTIGQTANFSVPEVGGYRLYRCDFVISPIGIYQNPAAHKPGLNFSLATLDQNEIQFGIIPLAGSA